MDDMDVKRGSILDRRYRVERCLGQGSAGHVFLCNELSAGGTRVVLKTLVCTRPGEWEPDSLRQDFSVLSRVKHPALVRILDFGVLEETGAPYLVEEYVEGADLLRATESSSVEALMGLAVEMCRAVHYLHARGILHGDLKPSNVLVPQLQEADHPPIKVLGYGLARSPSGQGLKRVAGSLGYAAPELLSGAPADSRADLYSLGIVLYEILVRRRPFEDEDAGFLLQKQLHGAADMRPFERIEKGRALAQVVRTLIEKEPEKRPQSAEEVIRLLSVASGCDCTRMPAHWVESYFTAGRFVGRSEEMALLKDRAGQVRQSGRGWTVFLTGEPGAGKTRCMQELRIGALLEGWRAVQGNCAPTERQSYAVYRRILAGGGVAVSAHDERVGRDPLRVNEPVALDHAGETAAGQFRDQLTREVVQRLTGKPTVLFLEDFQWADEATTTVLEYLSCDIMAHPVLLCVSVRPGESSERPVDKVIAQVLRQERGEVLALDGLGPDAVTELVVSITGEETLGSAMAPWIWRSSGGNPFFIEEMLKNLVDRGVLLREQGRWKLEGDSLQGLEVPAGVAAILRQRFDRLSAPAKEIACWLAVFNRTVNSDDLQAARSGSLEPMIDELASRQIVRRTQAGETELIEFCHAVIAEVIISGVSAARRRTMHEKIKRVLQDRYGEAAHVQELARHSMGGHGGAEAIGYALRAAAECRAEFAYDAALLYYEYVLARRSLIASDACCRVAMDAAEAYCALGTPANAVRLLQRLLRRMHGSRSPELISRVCDQLSNAFQFLGQYRLSELAARRGLKILSRSVGFSEDERTIRARLLCRIAFCTSTRSGTRKGLTIAENVLNLIRGAQDDSEVGHVLVLKAALCWIAGEFVDGFRSAKLATEILEPSAAKHLLAMAYSHLGINQMALGRLTSATKALFRSVELATAARSIVIKVQALSNSVECWCRSGQFDQASDMLKQVLKHASETGNASIEYAADATALELRVTRKEYERACDIVNRIQTRNSMSIPIYSRIQILYQTACLNLDLGDWSAVNKNLQELHRFGSDKVHTYEGWAAPIVKARLHIDSGYPIRAIKSLTRLQPVIRKKKLTYQRCLLNLALCEAYVSAGQFEKAHFSSRLALRLSRGIGAKHLEAEAIVLKSESNRVHRSKTDGCSDAANSDFVNNIFVELWHALEISQEIGLNELCARIQLEIALWLERQGKYEAALTEANMAGNYFAEIATLVPEPKRALFKKARRREAWCDQYASILSRLSAKTIQIDWDSIHQEHLRTLLRASAIINTCLDKKTLCEQIVNLLVHAIRMERVVLCLRDEELGKMIIAACGSIAKSTTGVTIETIMGLCEEVGQKGKPLLSCDVEKDPRIIYKNNFGSCGIGTVMCAPLRGREKMLGVLYTDKPSSGKALDESFINLFAGFCNLASVAIDNAEAYGRVAREKAELQQYLRDARDGYTEIIGRSECIVGLRERLAQAARSPMDVLVQGESGTGKELVARAIHRTGRRSAGRFVAVDCGSLSDGLIDSELFGYRKGAFTGAVESRAGIFEAANGGVVFLDEIGNLSLKLQGKLLRVLQEREVRPLGDSASRKIDVQVIAATNRKLAGEVRRGRFREDLFYRLNVMEISVPPLRDRLEDLPLLISWFLENTIRAEGGYEKRFGKEALRFLTSYSYPGNVRELKNTVQSAYYRAIGNIIGMDELPRYMIDGLADEKVWKEDARGAAIFRNIRNGLGSFDSLVRKEFAARQFGSNVVRDVITRALAECGGKYREAFRLLRIPDSRYSVMLLFLKRNNCYIDFRRFRLRRG
jgi:Nif-specific regulatory protein